MGLWIVLAVLALCTLGGYLGKKAKRNQIRRENGGAWVANDAKWADKPEFGKYEDYVIVVKDPDEYISALVNDQGKHVTGKKFQDYKHISENFDFEELTITTYGIYVDDEYVDKFFFYCGGASNSKSAPRGYRLESSAQGKPKNFCPYCGSQLDGDFKHCPKCGKALG